MTFLTCEYRLAKVVVWFGVKDFVTCDLKGNVRDTYTTSVISAGHRGVEDVEVFV